MRINIYAHLIIIEILDDIYARAQTWSTVEYTIELVYSTVDQLFARAKDWSTISIIIKCAKSLFAHVLRFQ